MRWVTTTFFGIFRAQLLPRRPLCLAMFLMGNMALSSIRTPEVTPLLSLSRPVVTMQQATTCKRGRYLPIKENRLGLGTNLATVPQLHLCRTKAYNPGFMVIRYQCSTYKQHNEIFWTELVQSKFNWNDLALSLSRGNQEATAETKEFSSRSSTMFSKWSKTTITLGEDGLGQKNHGSGYIVFALFRAGCSLQILLIVLIATQA